MMAEDPRIEYLRCRIGANRTMAAEIVRDMDSMKPKPEPRPAEGPRDTHAATKPGHETSQDVDNRILSIVEADRALLTRLLDKVRDLARQQNELQNEIVKMKASREAARAITELDAAMKILG